jgi:ribose/xylose/arabinose/galactoside ABC-type transport system permease subunit
VALVALLLFGVVRYGENFYSEYNIQEVLRYNAMFGLIALGMTFVIMTGGIDLSVGAVAAMSSVVLALLSPHGAWIAIGGAVGAGLAVGLINGGIIAYLRIQPFIVTLAMLLAARGGSAHTGGQHQCVCGFPERLHGVGSEGVLRDSVTHRDLDRCIWAGLDPPSPSPGSVATCWPLAGTRTPPGWPVCQWSESSWPCTRCVGR